MLSNIRVRANIFRAAVALVVVLLFVHNSHPEWVWLGLLINAILLVFIGASLAGIIFMFARARRVIRRINGRDESDVARFKRFNNLGSRKATGKVVEAELVDDKEAK